MHKTIRHKQPIGLHISVKLAVVVSLSGPLSTTSHASDVAFNAPGEGWVTAISNTGVAAGSSTASGEYFMWSHTTGNVIIGGVSAGGGVGGQAGINAAGTVVSGSEFNPLSGKHEAARYELATGTWTTLGGILVEGDTTQPGCAGDYGDDGHVDIADLLTLLDGWGTPAGDLNDDGLTDIEDLLILIGNWGPCE
jgi:hypothetical protein